jgi:hypothetical protein
MLVADAAYFTFGRGLHPRHREAYRYVAHHRAAGERVAVNHVSWVGRYYLEEANVRPVAGPEELAERPRPTWLVAVNKGRGRAWEQWDRAGSDLRRRFEVWSRMPIASVSVYHHAGNEQQVSSD